MAIGKPEMQSYACRAGVIGAALFVASLTGCSSPKSEQYSYAPVAEYVRCTTRARAGLDPHKVSAEQAAAIVDRCEKELRTVAQALAARQAFERQPDPEERNLTAKQRYSMEMTVQRDLAMCATSTQVDKRLCAGTD